MADTSVPALLDEAKPIEVEDRLRTSLTEHSLIWMDDRLVPISSSIPDRRSLAPLREAFDLACQPADPDLIKAWLSVLWISTKKQSGMADLRTDNVLRVYVAALSKYPADLVEQAIATWAEVPKPRDAHHWWPAAGELVDAIRGPSETRRMIRNGLMEWDMDKGKSTRLSQLYRELAVLEGGDFTFAVRHLLDADREEQIEGLRREQERVRSEIFKIEGRNTFARAAGEA
jgi:hypothetical protein